MVAAVDPFPAAREWASRQLDARLPLFESLGDALNAVECDAVLVITPPSTHHAVVSEALTAGKHVLNEKPLAMPVSAYFKRNIYVTFSGVAWEPAIQFCKGTLGIDSPAPVGFSAIPTQIAVTAPDATPDQLAALREKAEKYCVVLSTLRTPPPIETTWE